MDPKDFASLLRRRWLWLVFFAALGASLGYASTLLGDDEDLPVVDYWNASERLVVNPERDAGIDFQGTAVFAVSGEIPRTIAEERGVEPEQLISQIRVVSDATEGIMIISASRTRRTSPRTSRRHSSSGCRHKGRWATTRSGQQRRPWLPIE